MGTSPLHLNLRKAAAVAAACMSIPLALAAPASAGKARTTATAAAVEAPVQPTRWFAADSFWNKPLANDAPLDARSAAWTAHLVTKVTTTGRWINTTSYSAPIYTVPANQPLVKVKIDWPTATYDSEFESGVPVPAGLKAAAGDDGRAVIYQPSTDTLWEFWQMRIASDGLWHANTAGKIVNVSQDHTGLFASHPYAEPYGAAASQIPVTPGLITPDELKNGAINHVVSLAIPHPLHFFWWSWPATRSDGDSFDWFDVPEGARFRLPANLDLTKLGLTRTGLTIARAVQKYGMVVTDKSTTVHFYAQDPVNLGSDPYPALFGNVDPSTALKGFPWAAVQALQSQPNSVLPPNDTYH